MSLRPFAVAIVLLSAVPAAAADRLQQRVFDLEMQVNRLESQLAPPTCGTDCRAMFAEHLRAYRESLDRLPPMRSFGPSREEVLRDAERQRLQSQLPPGQVPFRPWW